MPKDLEEAARIDGAGFFTTFWRVMLPLAGPALAAVAILQFQGTWNSFFWPADPAARPDALDAAARLWCSSAPVGRLLHELAAADGDRRDGHHPHPGPVHLLPALLRRGHRRVRASRADDDRHRRDPATEVEAGADSGGADAAGVAACRGRGLLLQLVASGSRQHPVGPGAGRSVCRVPGLAVRSAPPPPGAGPAHGRPVPDGRP